MINWIALNSVTGKPHCCHHHQHKTKTWHESFTEIIQEKEKTSRELHNLKEKQHRTLNSLVIQCKLFSADKTSAPRSCEEWKGLDRRRANTELELPSWKRKKESNAPPVDWEPRQQPCSSTSRPDSELTNCLVVVPLLTTDSMTLENEEGKNWQLLRAEEEKSSPTMDVMLETTSNTFPRCWSVSQLVQVPKKFQHQLFATLLET